MFRGTSREGRLVDYGIRNSVVDNSVDCTKGLEKEFNE